MNKESPFLDIKSFMAEEVTSETYEASTTTVSPFLTLYEAESGGMVDPQSEEYVTFLNQLYDEEFDEALSSLVDEATEIYETHFGPEHEHEDPRTVGYRAERMLNQHFAPLVGESEALFEFLARELNQRDPNRLSDEEIESMLERYQPSSQLAPNFDQLFGSLKNLAKKAVSTVANVAKKGLAAAATLGLGPVLNKLKGLIKPLLQRVIQKAIDKLPPTLRPIAEKLKDKLPFLKEFEESDDFATEADSRGDLSELQYEFNMEVANLLFADNEAEQDLEIAKVVREQNVPDSYPIAELDQARERLIDNLQHLQEGESPAPYIENFLPALLPALRLGVKLVGRQKVVNFLANLLAKLLQKFVGPQVAPALSKAVVDAGLRLLQMETTEDESRSAASAIAATVEETVQRVAALPEYVLDNQELLEGFALEAFEQAAAANLPAILPEETYKKRPELAEAKKVRGMWLMRPGKGHRRYKAFTRKFRKLATPHQLSELETQDGLPLSSYLEEQLGMAPGEEAEAVVHLYEVLPGASLSEIVRHETHIPRINGTDAHEQLHPLTREAAAVLTGEPALGREMEHSNGNDAQVGQRYYYLEIPGKRPLTVPAPAGKTAIRRKTKTKLVFDFPKSEARVYLFLSEIRAQELAVKLRQHAHVGTAITRLRQPIQKGMNKAFSGHPKRLKIIHEAVVPGKWEEALKRLPSVVHQTLMGRLTEWVMTALANQIKQRADEFLKAAEDTADGVTLLITLENPPGFPELRQALKAKGISPNSLKLPEGSPTAKIMISAGYKHE
jgi:hypothetical protein